MSATITEYSPDGMETAGNSRIVVIPTVADINAITLAEWNSGTAIECATTAFALNTETNMIEKRYLCDKIARQRPGARNVTVEALVVEVGDPQAENALLSLLAEDSTVVIAHRPGVEHRAAAASGQKYQAVRVLVTSQNLVGLSGEEGQTYEATHGLAVQAKNDGFLSELAA